MKDADGCIVSTDMPETFKFITGDADHNRKELDRITKILEGIHEGYAINVSQEVNDTRAKLRFTLSPVMYKATDETQYQDYELATVDIPANEDVEELVIINPASDAIRDYETGDRL